MGPNPGQASRKHPWRTGSEQLGWGPAPRTLDPASELRRDGLGPQEELRAPWLGLLEPHQSLHS